MIRKTPKGYIIVSRTGKKIGGPYKSRSDAVIRLKQIEYFKNKG